MGSFFAHPCIFSNTISHDVISGNITATKSDHILQFLFVPNVLSKTSCQKFNIYEKDWSKSIQADFVLVLIKIGLMFSN